MGNKIGRNKKDRNLDWSYLSDLDISDVDIEPLRKFKKTNLHTKFSVTQSSKYKKKSESSFINRRRRNQKKISFTRNLFQSDHRT